MKHQRFVQLAVVLAPLALAACENKSTVRISNDRPPPVVQTRSRSEPVFYNGRTYRLDYSAAASAGLFDMRVSGMGSGQKKDAVAVATSSLGYFACPEGQRGRLQGEPAYVDAKWRMQAKCG